MEKRRGPEDMVITNHYSRRQFRRREGSGRITTNRPISFENLFTSGKTVVSPPSTRIKSTTHKENVNRDSHISQNIEEFWATERQKKISAVARRKLTGAKQPLQECNQQPVEDRHTRHARARRGGGKRRYCATSLKLDIYHDVEKISGWDKENLSVEEEGPNTIAASRAFMSASKLSLAHGCTKTSVEEAGCRSKPQDERSSHEGHGHNEATSTSSLLDMDLSSGDSPTSLFPDILSTQDCPPDLASLVDIDMTSGEFPASFMQNIFIPQECPPNPGQDMETRLREAQKNHLSLRSVTIPHGPPKYCPDVEAGQLTLSPSVSICHSQCGRHGDQGRRILDSQQGYFSSLFVDWNLQTEAPLARQGNTPVQNSSHSGSRLPVTSPTPPSNPLALYMSRRHLEKELGVSGQRRLAFASASPTQTDDTADEKTEEVAFCAVDQDKIMSDGEECGINCSESYPKGLASGKESSVKAAFNFSSLKDDQVDDWKVEKPPSSGEGSLLSSSGVQLRFDRRANMKTQDALCNGAGPEDHGLDFASSLISSKGVIKHNTEVQDGKWDGVDLEDLSSNPLQCEDINLPFEKAPDARSDSEDHLGTSLRVKPQDNLEVAEESDESPRVEEAHPADCKSDGTERAGKAGSLNLAEGSINEDNDVEATDVARVELSTKQLHEAAESKVNLPCDTDHSREVDGGQKRLEEGNVNEVQLELQSRSKRGRRRKAPDRRSSLEDCENGSAWKDGRRHSQRRRVRPLEWWRGEKVLYGRVHETLTTMIGIKHSSPGQYSRGIRVPFTVESYVPAKYNDMIRFLAN